MSPAKSKAEQRETRPTLSRRAIFDAAPDGLVIVDDQGVIRDANERLLEMLGYGWDELVGSSVEAIVPGEARTLHRQKREQYLENPRSRPMGIGLELRALRRDGRQLPVEISLRPHSTPEGRWVIAAVRDVSERRRLQHLGAGTLRAAEAERERIARELHDDTAQCLAALLVRIPILRRTSAPAERERLMDEMHEALTQAVEGVRRISRGLRPPALEDVGVDAAIRAHVRGLLEAVPLRVELDLEPVGSDLPPEARLVVYRVVQEALTNVVRHARAETARVELSASDREVVARVTDDGVGFDAETQLLSGEGLGLLGMDERARLVGGTFEIRSTPGRGTFVELRIPTDTGSGVDVTSIPTPPGEPGG
jgi:PAS domain S-box-containing protein